ncbi:hypothetical protein L6164_017301 [Bauhinia variegata]|uniref:Uncharacterized protein n=1 Tax=Bauhinia variegata TaxID=167791 RepID=A0ACB9N918_BAUVA|nr:hypothetical protein L6164_017301 [Bauhinia variegata]
MHDLIQDMGTEIVRQESPNDPGQRSRLLLHEDILQVLQDNAGSNRVQGIKLTLSEPEELQLTSKSFKKMKKLRLLIIHNAQCSGDLKYLPSELRWLEWPGYPFSSLPVNFSPKKLVFIDMYDSRLTLHPISWSKDFKSLKYMNLKASCLPKLANLRHLNVSKCKHLQEIPELPENIEVIEARGCESLQRYSQLESMLRLSNGLGMIDFSDCHRLIKTHGYQWTNILPSERFVNKPEVRMWIPGSEIPQWFSHKGSESSISFRMPVNASTNIIALALGAVLRSTLLKIEVFINGECKYFSKELHRHTMESDHLWIFYIPQIFLPSSREDYIDFKVKAYENETSCLKALGVHLMEGQYKEITKLRDM